MEESQHDNPYDPPNSVESNSLQLSSRSPYSLCCLPFAFGSWLVLAVVSTIDAPTEHTDGHFLFVGRNAILFSIFLMSPPIAYGTSLISFGWVEFRLRKDDSRVVRRRVAFMAGVMAPLVTYSGISLLMLFAQSIGEIVNWMVPVLFVISYLAFGEIVVKFSARADT